MVNKKNVVDDAIKQIDGYLLSIYPDIELGCYALKMGINADWEFENNEMIVCNSINETDSGKIIEIKPNENYHEEVKIDDLITFAKFIIKVNEEIAEKEKEFKLTIKKEKEEFEERIKSFYDSLSDMKSKTFNTIKNTNNISSLDDNDVDSSNTDEITEKHDVDGEQANGKSKKEVNKNEKGDGPKGK